MSTLPSIHNLAKMKAKQEKISMLTVYDASMAALMNQAGIDVILVGDSLGNVIQGHTTTVPVTLDDICYHTRCVARGNETALLLADMPFMSYATVDDALKTATALMRAGAQFVKLEGGESVVPCVRALVAAGISVCGHLGLTPQSVHHLGGFKVQGRDEATANRLLREAQALEDAGCCLLVLECVPAGLAADITAQLGIPTIGIGAGSGTDGQVSVTYDLLGIVPGKPLKIAKNFLAVSENGVLGAFQAYREAVKAQTFPAVEHIFE